MKKKIFLALLAITLSMELAFAQQVFRISQFGQHNFLYNPAASGGSDLASGGMAYRKMWEGMPGGPETAFLYFDTYFSKKKTGLAVVVYSDKTGPTSRNGGEVNLSYSIEMNNGSRLMFGLGGQVLQYRINKEEMAKFIPGDPLLDGSGTSTVGDASAGIYWNGKHLHLGFAAKQLVQSKLNFIKGNTNPEGRLYRHYFLTGDYEINTDEDNTIIPAVAVKYLPSSPVDVEITARLVHKDVIWVGAGWRKDQSVNAFAGLKPYPQLAIGYAFEIYKQPISIFDGGGTAHELSLKYFFWKK